MQVKFPLALEDLSLALTLAPSLASAHYNWATIQYRMGCYTTALPAFLRYRYRYRYRYNTTIPSLPSQGCRA